MSTVGDLIESTCASLSAAGLVFGHGSDSAWDEACALVLGVTGLADDRASLPEPVAAVDESRIRELLERRISERMPLAYLLGRCWFAGRQYLIEPGVVIPRSPIGELIGQRFEPWLLEPPRRILDLCTGSGCIGIAAAHAFPDAAVTLVDLDPHAVALARRNVVDHRLSARVQVCEGDLFAALHESDAAACFDLILSNPPYVDRADMQSLPAEFQHEPGLGLDGGGDGLDVVRRIVDESAAHLSESGVLICEVGMSAAALSRAYPQLPFFWPEFEQGGEGVFVLTAPWGA